ncbi:hypothetical protein BU14_0151s0002 [Porphyra umbilicalis]|uniref:Uncharacterized protein n=1 Tax=Porphyra umbilicalis TaxID=2786 RepID=A0A1X6P9B6_PORUM|nr:hypothetical protein BU14_0151s0002 [Porphyra umbilicalis]|eukprot:OSX77360.1 hypothetical protein BU14_0151s0002 [Porphyra umbilicalis]
MGERGEGGSRAGRGGGGGEEDATPRGGGSARAPVPRGDQGRKAARHPPVASRGKAVEGGGGGERPARRDGGGGPAADAPAAVGRGRPRQRRRGAGGCDRGGSDGAVAWSCAARAKRPRRPPLPPPSAAFAATPAVRRARDPPPPVRRGRRRRVPPPRRTAPVDGAAAAPVASGAAAAARARGRGGDGAPPPPPPPQRRRRRRRPSHPRPALPSAACIAAAAAAAVVVALGGTLRGAPPPLAAAQIFAPAPPSPEAVVLDDTLPEVDYASQAPFRSGPRYNFFGRAVAGVPVAGAGDRRRLVVASENAYEVGELVGAGAAASWTTLYNQSSTPFRTSNLGVSLALVNGSGAVGGGGGDARDAPASAAVSPALAFVAADDFRALLYLGWPEVDGAAAAGGAPHTHGLWANASAPGVGFDSDYAASRAAKWGSSTASMYRSELDATVVVVGAPGANAVSVLQLPRSAVRAASTLDGAGGPDNNSSEVALQHLRLTPEDSRAVVAVGDAAAGGNETTGMPGAPGVGLPGSPLLPAGAELNANGTVTVPVTGFGKHVALDGRFLAVSASNDVTVLQWNETASRYGSSVSLRRIISADTPSAVAGFEGGALALNADRLLVAAPTGGTYAFHYEEADGKWLFDKVLARPVKPVAVAMDEHWAVVGGDHRVVAHKWDAGRWVPALTLTDPSKATGFVYAAAVALVGGVAVVGEPIFDAVHVWDLRAAPTPSPPPRAPPTPVGLPLTEPGADGRVCFGRGERVRVRGRGEGGEGLVPLADVRRGDWVEAWVPDGRGGAGAGGGDAAEAAAGGWGGSAAAAARAVAAAVLPPHVAAAAGVVPPPSVVDGAVAAASAFNGTADSGGAAAGGAVTAAVVPAAVARRVWSPVVLVQHASSMSTAPLLTLTVRVDARGGGGGGGGGGSGSGDAALRTVTLTPNHGLLTGVDPPTTAPAGALRVGDRLFMAAPGGGGGVGDSSGDGSVVTATVVGTSAAPPGRVVNVHTAAGTVIVGGVLASCYPALTLGGGRWSVATVVQAAGLLRLAGVVGALGGGAAVDAVDAVVHGLGWWLVDGGGAGGARVAPAATAAAAAAVAVVVGGVAVRKGGKARCWV